MSIERVPLLVPSRTLELQELAAEKGKHVHAGGSLLR